jgi:hypothetical protein
VWKCSSGSLDHTNLVICSASRGSVLVPERGAQHRGGADAGAVRRVQHAEHHQQVPERADHHRAHPAGAALLLLRRRRALRGRAEARHQRPPRRSAAARHAQLRGGGHRPALPLRGPRRCLPSGRSANGFLTYAYTHTHV